MLKRHIGIVQTIPMISRLQAAGVLKLTNLPLSNKLPNSRLQAAGVLKP